MRALLLAGMSLSLAAHDLAYTVYADESMTAIWWTYAGQEPVRFAKIEVYSPADSSRPFQTGRTDSNGAFAFLPDRQGRWRVAIDDEEGHKLDAAIEISRAGAAGSHPGRLSAWVQWVLGLAAIAALTGGLMFWRGRKG